MDRGVSNRVVNRGVNRGVVNCSVVTCCSVVFAHDTAVVR